MNKRRVMVIGLDGATFALLEPLMASGVMPFLARFREESAYGELLSTMPPVTAPAWASFMTGVNPGRHGIYEFAHRQRGSLSQVPVNATYLQSPTLWQRLSTGGVRVGVINVPLTYPPTPVNGFLISGLMTPRGARDFTYPRALLDELEARFGPYRLHHRQVYTKGRVHAVLSEARAILDYRLQTARYLLQQRDWDFFMVYFQGTDRVQHELWHILDETHPAHDLREAAQHAEDMLGFFRVVDDAVRELATQAPNDTTVIVMSDHGFGPIHKFLNFNVWLLQQGFLELKSNVTARLKYLAFRNGLTPAFAYRLAMRLGLAHLRLAAGMTKRATLLHLLERSFLSLSNVDWSRTVAYSRGNYGQIFINLQGREPHGIVTPVEYETVRETIIERLRKLTDPETGEPIIARVFRTEELYWGERADCAPDLLPITRDMRYKPLGTVSFTSHRLVEPTFGNSGDHRMEGVLFLCSSGVRPGHRLSNVYIVDLTPTILYLLEQPVPANLDGTVLTEAFDQQFLSNHPILWEEDRYAQEKEQIPVGYTLAEEKAVLEQLRRLGYVT
jgi:predicted AlkP superfamily phosphohydrolase/phosphomutase